MTGSLFTFGIVSIDSKKISDVVTVGIENNWLLNHFNAWVHKGWAVKDSVFSVFVPRKIQVVWERRLFLFLEVVNILCISHSRLWHIITNICWFPELEIFEIANLVCLEENVVISKRFPISNKHWYEPASRFKIILTVRSRWQMWRDCQCPVFWRRPKCRRTRLRRNPQAQRKQSYHQKFGNTMKKNLCCKERQTKITKTSITNYKQRLRNGHQNVSETNKESVWK